MDKFDYLKKEVESLFKRLPQSMHYHNYNHTLDVLTQVERIAQHEKIHQFDLLLLKTAALFHDTGFLINYRDHEKGSIHIAKPILKKHSYNPSQINVVCKLIEKTKLPHNPETKLQQILCDADMDNLGRSDFLEKNELLRKELQENQNVFYTEDEWYNLTLNLLKRHHYFTSAQQNRTQYKKTINHKLILEKIESDDNFWE